MNPLIAVVEIDSDDVRYSGYRPVPERAVRTTYPTASNMDVDSLRRARHPQESTGGDDVDHRSGDTSGPSA